MRKTRCRTTPDGRRLRVLHVINSLDGGGTERVLTTFLRTVAETPAEGSDHAVCCLREAGELACRVPAAVPVTALGARGASRMSALRLAKVVRRLRPDVVHARGVAVWADAVVATTVTRGACLLLGFHGMESDRGFHRARRWWLRRLRHTSARFVSVSHAGRELLERTLALPPDRIDIIANGVDVRRFHPPDEGRRRQVRASLGVDTGDCVVGTVGSLTPVKDHETLLSAAAAAPRREQVRLLLVGTGPLLEGLRDQARRLGIEDTTIFAGQREDVPDLLGAMDVYVSSSRYEGMSNALLEAMASGLPVIATDVGDNRRLVGLGPCGEIVPPSDVSGLADRIASLAANDTLRTCWGRRGRQQVMEHYTFDRTVQRYLELYESAAGRRARPGCLEPAAACGT